MVALNAERRISRTVMACAVVGFLLLLVAGAATGWTVWRAQVEAHWVEHTYEVETRVSALRAMVEQAESTRRGVLLSPSPSRLARYETARRAVPVIVDQIAALTADNPRQQRRFIPLRAALARHDALLERSTRLAQTDRRAAAAAIDTDGSLPAIIRVRKLIDAMAMEERRLLDRRIADQRIVTLRSFALLAATGALAVGLGILAFLTLRRYMRDLVATREALEALNAGLETRVAERTTDLSRANDEIQRFAYIVSHDLRSPLVNVMGFTGELEAAARPLAALVDAAEVHAPQIVTEDARLAAREDLPESIRFIRSSTQKMDRLINAILKLSREGRRTLAPAPVDIAEVADDVVAALAHRLDAIGATVAVTRPVPPLVADRLALEQILSNLVENAVKYLDPARPGRIAVTARARPGHVEIAVVDNGRGIDPRDHDRIFDLFRRSGSQDQPGEGIGLAHVRALAYRMGGLVACVSTPGEGSTFTLTLPATPQNDQGRPE